MILNKEYVIGLIEGEGCFHISQNWNKIKRGKRSYKYQKTNRLFAMGMNIRDIKLLKNVQKTIGAGKVYEYPKRKIAVFHIANIEHRKKLIEFIESTSGLKGYKKQQYKDWKTKQ